MTDRAVEFGRRPSGFGPVSSIEGRFGSGGFRGTQISEQPFERAVATVVAGATPAFKVDALPLLLAAVLEEEIGRRQPKIPRDVSEREDEDPEPSRNAVHTLADGRSRPQQSASEEREEQQEPEDADHDRSGRKVLPE